MSHWTLVEWAADLMSWITRSWLRSLVFSVIALIACLLAARAG
jgi:hypothetical protein